MDAALIEPHYFPNLEYFCALLPYDKIFLEGHEHYAKQTLRNRCYINSTQGKLKLSVPLNKESGKVVFRDVKVEGGMRWRNNHWRTIQSAYAKAPYYEHFSDDVARVIYLKSDSLFEIDNASLSFCLRILGQIKQVSPTDMYQRSLPSEVLDLRSRISDRIPDEDKFYYRAVPYYQVFGSGFASNLSLIDLLFCEGPGALTVLKASAKEELNK
jgi:hypothetical protein